MDFLAMKLTPDKHLHSREHLLADDLSRMMLESKRFAAYLGVAKMYHESDLRALAKRVLEKRDLEPANRGKYFFAALKGLPKKYIFRVIASSKRSWRRISKPNKNNGRKTNRKSTAQRS